ncbi:glycosyltransferase [Peterkaempfera bronchialis]|uniref:Glycosyltransferase n=1 Tax=Peterkaempfera bronchialis TaxID=2126346 RepID=A0A345SZM6_9ACTN|nr:glycosyltransferase [Peterkaempfera bronchialis]AXI79181.1 glycosyltransferase [Peterkaempfera bronchialis]
MNVLLCPLSDPGFRYPALAVGLELRRRGHTVRVLAPGGAAGPLPPGLDPAATAGPEDATAFRVGNWFRYGAAQYRAVREAARRTRADALVTSVLCHGALLAAETLDLPVAVLGLAAHLWPYAAGGQGEPERPALRAWRLHETLGHYARAREDAGLPPRRDRAPERPLTGDALLLRGHPAFEYPGAELPERIHRVGPCWWEPAPDPADLATLADLDARIARCGKPLVYVHHGRSFGGSSLWPWLNAAFTGGPYQAVVETGRSGPARPAPGADLLPVRHPWMTPLITRATAVVASGTTAPVLAALLTARPLLLHPAGGEQPLLTEACLRAGVAHRAPADPAAAPTALDAARTDPALRARTTAVGDWLRRSPGPPAAATLIESLSHPTPAVSPAGTLTG